MDDALIERSGLRLLQVAEAGPALGSYTDATDLVGQAFSEQASVVVIPMERLDPDFFRLRSSVAGKFIQKIVQYGLKLAIMGDISVFTAKSEPLRDFVRESSRGGQGWFVDDLEAVLEKLDGL